MPGQGDIRARRAFVEVFTDDSKLQQGLIAINKRMDAWSQQQYVELCGESSHYG